MNQNIFESIKLTFEDLMQGLSLWRYWLYRSWVQYQLKYRSTKLGLLWPIISLVILVVALGTVWGVILNKQSSFDYFLYLAVGFPIWQVIANSVTLGNLGYQGALGNSGLPFSVPIFERINQVFIAYANVLPLVIIFVLIVGSLNITSFLLILWSLMCLLIWSIGTILFISVVVTLKPDLKELVSALMRLAFLATPIIWESSRLGEFQKYLWFNPFYAPLEFARSSMSGANPSPGFALETSLYSVSVFVLGLTVFSIFSAQLRLKAV